MGAFREKEAAQEITVKLLKYTAGKGLKLYSAALKLYTGLMTFIIASIERNY
jgi:hypothetical protein